GHGRELGLFRAERHQAERRAAAPAGTAQHGQRRDLPEVPPARRDGDDAMPVSARTVLVLLSAAGTLLWSHAFAQQQAPQPPPVPVPSGPGGETMVSLDFQDADITEVISTIAKATGKNFLYDDRVRGRVTVISPEPVTVDEAYRVFESILAVKGFTTVPAPGGVLKILPLRDAKENPIETVPGNKVAEDRDTFITRL